MTEQSLLKLLEVGLQTRVQQAVEALSSAGLESRDCWPMPAKFRTHHAYFSALYEAAATALVENGWKLDQNARKRCLSVVDRLGATATVAWALWEATNGQLTGDDLALLVLSGSRLQRSDAELPGRPEDLLWRGRDPKRPRRAKYASVDFDLLDEVAARLDAGEDESAVWTDVAARAPGQKSNVVGGTRQRLQRRARTRTQGL